MRLHTQRTAEGTQMVQQTDDGARVWSAPDVGAWLRDQNRWTVVDEISPEAITPESLAPVVLQPGKIFCLGLNYAPHILEMGRTLPEHPTLFSKFADALIGAADPITVPKELDTVDWEAELVIVIGDEVRNASAAEAGAAIAGFSVGNDVTSRGHQGRTLQWLQGKTWEGSTPLGPALVTQDELGGPLPDLAISAHVDGEEMQAARTGDMVFNPVACVEYISQIITLRPGDLIFTGTPGGVGHARDPQVYLKPGQQVTVEIETLGAVSNRRAQ